MSSGAQLRFATTDFLAQRVHVSVLLGPVRVRPSQSAVCCCVPQDGRADVVANDAGDRVTPAVVAYRDDEQVR